MARAVLGKGIGALFSEEEAAALKNTETVSRETPMVRISLIEPNANQPRKDFDQTALEELADSIKKYGILQPLLVKKVGKTYQIVAGERRWRAAKLAGLKEVPIIEKELTDGELAEVALIENLQREDLNPVEEAYAYKSLIDDFGLTQDEVAERVSKNRSTVTNSLRLLQLDDEILKMLSDGSLTAGHARAILSVADKDKRKTLAEKVISQGLSVREIEKISKETKKKTVKKKNTEDDYLKEASSVLTRALGTKVMIRPGSNGGGKIEIDYYSTDSLNALIERFV